MNDVEFARSMLVLDCNEHDAYCVFRMVSSLRRNYSWVSVDELLAWCLSMVPRAKDTYDSSRARFTTHLVTVSRNACLSFLHREEVQHRRAIRLKEDLGRMTAISESDGSADYRDALEVLSRVLSPYAERLFALIRQSAPRRLTDREACDTLRLGVTSVSHLRREVSRAVALVLGEPGGNGKERK